jgi:hypothetical protein
MVPSDHVMSAVPKPRRATLVDTDVELSVLWA